MATSSVYNMSSFPKRHLLPKPHPFTSGKVYTVSSQKLFLPTSRNPVCPGDKLLIVESPKWMWHEYPGCCFRALVENSHEFWIASKYWHWIVPWEENNV